MNKYPKHFVISKEMQLASQVGSPLVVLESAVITHGLPYPENLNTARELESVVHANGAMPATIALLHGQVHIGLTVAQMEELASLQDTHKISIRDLGVALAKGWSGGTTVAATSFVAAQAGLKVFATGGIGGVHRGTPFDISADLPQLSKTPLIVVCAGAKAILDLPATREVLETQGIPVIGYQTDEFPAFYTSKSDLSVDVRVESPEEAARIALATWDAGLGSALLLVVPPPKADAMSPEKMENAIQIALREAEENDIHGSATTPFLLRRVSELTQGESLQANLALLKNNAMVAAQVAGAMHAINKTGPF
ncbi:MAG: pseudouridine-5'-phosphate glycosidase [Anaerolineales bacterium]